MNSRKCDVCDVEVHRASYAKHLKSKNHLEKMKQNEMIIPEWLFKEPTENRIKNIYISESLRQISRDNIKLDEKQLNKEIAKKMNNPYYFTDRAIQVGLNITLESHQTNHANFKIFVQPNYAEFGIEIRYINKDIKEKSAIYARLKNQYKFKYRTVFSATFDKQHEDNQVLDETELFINLNINHSLAESDLHKIDVNSSSEHQIEQQEIKDSGWRFDKINSMTVSFYKTGEMNELSYVKIPSRSSDILNYENNDK